MDSAAKTGFSSPNPMDIREIFRISVKRKKIILVSLIAGLGSCFLVFYLTKPRYSTKIYITSNYIPSYQLKSILSDFETLVADRMSYSFNADTKKEIENLDAIYLIKSDLISDKDIADNKILQVEIQTYADTIFPHIKNHIIDLFNNNKYINDKSEYEKAKLKTLLRNVKDLINKMETRQDITETLYKMKVSAQRGTENLELPEVESELMVNLINFKNVESNLENRIHSFAPFIILNETLVITQNNYQSLLKLFLLFGILSIILGIIIAIVVESAKR